MFHFKITLLLLVTLFSQMSFAAGLLTPVDQRNALKIKDHKVDITVNHSFAVVEVEQIFSNPHDIPLEAMYSFPVPEQASVGEFTYWLNGVPVHAEVLEKTEAKRVYQEQKAQGRNAALVEKNSFIDFKIRISQVLPSEDVKIKLVYLQPVEIDHGVARFVYPLEFGGTDKIQKAFWTANEVVQENFSFNFELNSSYPVEEFRLPSHSQGHVEQISNQHWQVSLDNRSGADSAQTPSDSRSENPIGQTFRLDKDIVVYWRLSGDLQGGIDVMTYRAKGQEKGTFMMTLTPGNDLEALNEGRDWIVVIDHSGSMAGKYHTLLQGVRAGFHQFSANDRIKVILFNDSATLIKRSFTPAIPSELDSLIRTIENHKPDGGTNLYSGIKKALNELDSDRTSAIWLVTDGVANIGETKQQKFVSLLKKKDVRLFTFIMGNGANKPLLKGLTRASNGFAVNVSNSDDMTGLLLNAASKVNHQALRDIHLSFSGVKVTDVEPSDINSLYRGQQLVVLGHYWGEGELKVKLNAKRDTETVRYTGNFEIPKHGEKFPELERIWAFNQIESLLQQQEDFGHDSDRKEAIVDLAVEYGLVTDHTSMLIVEDDVLDALGINRNNSARIQREHQARLNRKGDPLTTTRVKENTPMFNQPRATYSNSKGSGGGLDIGFVLSILLIIGCRVYSQLKTKMQQLS